MSHTSFAERLQRIEATQNRPMKDRMLAGVAEESLSTHQKKKSAKAPRGAVTGRKPPIRMLRIVAGFVLMYAATLVLSRMNDIQGWVDGMAALAPYASQVMVAIAGAIMVVFVFFAFKLNRAAFRVLSEPRRLPFAIGMVLGLVIGIEPGQLSPENLAQFSPELLAQLL